MNDYMRESLSYFGLYSKMLQVKKRFRPKQVNYGKNKDQYFLFYEPDRVKSDKVIIWVHGGGWNAGTPKFFDFVGQCIAAEGYRVVSIGYRLSPKYKYPCQIKDVCRGFNTAVKYLYSRNIDISKLIVAGPSAGAHLTSLMCYSKKIQEKCGVDISGIIGYIGFGGPYSFRSSQSLTLRLLLDQFFKKGYDRRKGEPAVLMSKNHIPMLLIQSRHDGIVEYACAEDFARKAEKLGNRCELYSVVDKKNTHSWYTAGMFLESRCENKGLDKFFSWIEEL
jgi:acetyl esterase/lipase